MKNLFKNKYLRILVLSTILVLALNQTGILANLQQGSSTAQAVGDLTIDWGVPSGEPIFVISNFLPGDIESRTVVVTNGAPNPRPVGVRGEKTEKAGDLATVLQIKIFENSTLLYGPKNLADFFSESAGPEGIPLSTLSPSQTVHYIFEVTFEPSSGNEFQEKMVVFDLIIGIAFQIPDECLHIQFNRPPLFGTEGNDNINGTNGNEIILGFEGNDRLNGTNGDDCLVGGSGNDKLYGTNGQDVLLGEEGNDRLDGSNGDDLLYGGPGDDTFFGTNGHDEMYGDEGDDVFRGTNGNDKMYGGPGNDWFDASNGNDYVEAGEGDDEMKGGNGNDTLLGGEGQDFAHGGLGNDVCEAEEKIRCEDGGVEEPPLSLPRQIRSFLDSLHPLPRLPRFSRF